MIRLSKFYLLIGLLCCSMIKLAAQSEDPTANIIPPSPTVAALAKYGEIPVNMYTGTPNISIPLHSLTGDGLAANLSLSYHAGGIKVDEVASWVGLGWSLNGGGAISRTIRGKPDNKPGEGYFYQNIPSHGTTNNDLFNNYTSLLRGILETDNKDGEPDLYHFNADGLSGKFILDNNKEAHFIPHRDDITLVWEDNPSSINNDGWILTTSAGIRYYFGYGYREGGTTTSCSGSSSSGSTGWLLKRIENTATGTGIDFIYASYGISHLSSKTYTKYYPTDYQSNGCSPYDPDFLSHSTCTYINNWSSWHLSEIVSDYGRVVFTVDNSLTSREDVDGGVKLTKIDIRDAGDNLIKSFDFSYSYFQSSGTGEESKRLKLTQVQESSSSESNPPFVFDYLDQ